LARKAQAGKKEGGWPASPKLQRGEGEEIFASIIALIIGLMKPNIFARFLKERTTRKGTAMIFVIGAKTYY